MSRPQPIQLEEESRRAFINLLPPAWVHRDQVPDYHIDMEVVIAKDGKVTNEVFWVQIKATQNIEHSHGIIPFSIETEHLKYYENSRLPVIILLWVKPEDTFYYLLAQKYIREKLCKEDPSWRTRATKTIRFQASSKLRNADTLKSIATDGYFYIIQQMPSVGPEGEVIAPWLDGIPRSNDEMLKEHTLEAFWHMHKEEYKAAIAEYEYILRVICLTPSTERMAILVNLGLAYYWLGQLGEATKNYEAVLELAKKVGEKEAAEGKAVALSNIGLVYLAKSDLDNALKSFREALKIDREIGFGEDEAIDLGNIGLAYYDRGDLDNALKNYQESLRIHRKIGHRRGEASQLGNIGLVYYDRGDLDNALKHHRRALKIHRKISFRRGEAIELGNIGLVYYDRGDLDNALKNYQESLRIHRKIGHREGEAIQLGNIGLVYRNMYDLDNALKHHREALKIDREIGYRQGEAEQLGNIGMIYHIRGNSDSALKHLKQALSIFDMCGLIHERDIALRAIDLIRKATTDL